MGDSGEELVGEGVEGGVGQGGGDLDRAFGADPGLGSVRVAFVGPEADEGGHIGEAEVQALDEKGASINVGKQSPTRWQIAEKVTANQAIKLTFQDALGASDTATASSTGKGA